MNSRLRKSEWDKAADWWNTEAGDKGVWHQRHDIDPVIFKILGDVKNKMILEIGCGNGYFTRLLAKRGANAVGIDFSKKLLDFGIAKEKSKPLGIKYFARDASNLYGLKSKSFNIVIANMSFMDISDIGSAIREISRVLKKNGHLVFSITHPVFADSRQKWIIIKEKNKKYFARPVNRYLSSSSEKFKLWASGAKATQYYRSIGTYFNYLRSVGFLISEFIEIASKKQIKKTKKRDSSVKSNLFKCSTFSEKKMKEFARNEIPIFLIVGALKIH